MIATKPFSIKVIGAFDLVDRTGGSVRPSGRKDSAILAILALTRNHRQTRTWLQDKLWSDRGPAQGAASLRQALTTIRTILNVDDQVIQADRTWVWLDAEKVEFDYLLADASGEILRGFDLREEGFNDWLRETRSNFEAKQAGWGAIAVEARPDRNWHLDVATVQFASGISFEIGEAIADSLSEVLSVVGVHTAIDRRATQDAPTPRATDVVVTTRIIDTGEGYILSLRATDGFGNLRWQVRRETDVQDWSRLRKIQIEFAQLFQDFVIRTEAASLKGARWSAHSNGCQALLGIIAPGTVSLQEIQKCSEAALAAEEQGIYHALLGYSQLLQFGERESAKDLDAEVLMENFRTAVRHSPGNGLVQALAGHAYGFFSKNLTRNEELTAEAVRLLPNSGVCWIYFAISQVYRGQFDKAVFSASKAVFLCRGTMAMPLARAIEQMSRLMNGDIPGAIRAGEASLEVISMRPTIMDLMTCYSLSGQVELGRKKLDLLMARDPDLSLDVLRTHHYPIVNPAHRSLTIEAVTNLGLN